MRVIDAIDERPKKTYYMNALVPTELVMFEECVRARLAA